MLSFNKYSNTRLNDYFNSNEFDCRCGRDSCSETIVDEILLENLTVLRELIDEPIYINSAFRCKKHNRDVGGKRNSQHLLGKAADISVRGWRPTDVAELAEPLFRGIGIYKTFNHLDTRDGKIARWDNS